MGQRKQSIVTGGSMYWRQHPDTDRITLMTMVKDGPQAALYRRVHVPLDVLSADELDKLISSLQRMQTRKADEAKTLNDSLQRRKAGEAS
jgi:hypothetical protein